MISRYLTLILSAYLCNLSCATKKSPQASEMHSISTKDFEQQKSQEIYPVEAFGRL